MKAKYERVALEVERIINRDLEGESAERLKQLCAGIFERGADGSVREFAAVRETMTLLGEKWTGLVLYMLSSGPIRYSLLRRLISSTASLGGEKQGISERMMTLTLRRLERDGFASRVVLPGPPPRTEYELTPLGKSLHDGHMILVRWAENNRLAIQEARDRYDQAKTE
ncbi:transcriptional regulator, HxlR family protein [Novosphingobium sp. Rr 2-17]|uniref:winged helix-turn-helix transcriptional regulator n=1 Tax=Novosphingobium sp. Rr 2-17 TaxID=555793 RepID=UPI0002699BDE|nr:helix-turn-helix domain-containing protein [Novosphingobium sp. Rr 2-17]EIZ78821.1 transcriptional regulator, HxlR family protein [Novosphingobium sp. Rr 2-17]